MVVRTQITRHERHRRQDGYSVTGLAQALGKSHTYVSRVEAGQVAASPWYRSTVAALLSQPEDFLFDDEGFVR